MLWALNFFVNYSVKKKKKIVFACWELLSNLSFFVNVGHEVPQLLRLEFSNVNLTRKSHTYGIHNHSIKTILHKMLFK